MTKLFELLRKLAKTAANFDLSRITAKTYNFRDVIANKLTKSEAAQIERLADGFPDVKDAIAKLAYLANREATEAVAVDILRVLSQDPTARSTFIRLARIAKATSNGADPVALFAKPELALLEAAESEKAVATLSVLEDGRDLLKEVTAIESRLEGKSESGVTQLLSRAWDRAKKLVRQTTSGSAMTSSEARKEQNRLLARWKALSRRQKLLLLSFAAALVGGGVATLRSFMSDPKPVNRDGASMLPTRTTGEMTIEPRNIWTNETDGVGLVGEMQSTAEDGDEDPSLLDDQSAGTPYRCPCSYSPIIAVRYDDRWRSYFGLDLL